MAPDVPALWEDALREPGRLTFFSSDSYGVAHVTRNARIANATAKRHGSITALVATGAPADCLPVLSTGCDYLMLPTFTRLAEGGHQCLSLRLSYEGLRTWRSEVLSTAVEFFSPSVLITDHLTSNIRAEVEPMLLRSARWPHGSWRVLAFDDILNDPNVVHRDWTEAGLFEFAEAQYDEIWVYGDENVYSWLREYQLPPGFAAKVRHVGYLAGQVSSARRARIRSLIRNRYACTDCPMVLVTAGGGQDGLTLIDAYLSALEGRSLDRCIHTIIVTGPRMPEAQIHSITERLRSLTDCSVTLTRYLPDFEDHLFAVDAVVTMAGCTLGEIAAAGVPALMVARNQWPSSQTVRAQVMEAKGVGVSVAPEELDPVNLSVVLGKLISDGGQKGECEFRTNGYETTSARLAELSLEASVAAE